MTEAHYEQFVALYEKYHDQGFEILAFPSNEFGRQEPKSNEEIQQFVAQRGVKFPVFAKTTVNGKHAHPVFTYLRAKLSGLLGAYIKWNFTKFLCDRDGIPVKRFSPTDKPNACEDDIVALLAKPASNPTDAKADAKADAEVDTDAPSNFGDVSAAPSSSSPSEQLATAEHTEKPSSEGEMKKHTEHHNEASSAPSADDVKESNDHEVPAHDDEKANLSKKSEKSSKSSRSSTSSPKDTPSTSPRKHEEEEEKEKLEEEEKEKLEEDKKEEEEKSTASD